MSEAKKLREEQIEAFLKRSQEHRFQGNGRVEVYEWITRTLRSSGVPQARQADAGDC